MCISHILLYDVESQDVYRFFPPLWSPSAMRARKPLPQACLVKFTEGVITECSEVYRVMQIEQPRHASPRAQHRAMRVAT